MALSELKIRNIKAKKTTQRYVDSGGLALVVTPKNKRTWYYRYNIYQGKKRLDRAYQLGEYPLVSLAQARANYKRLSVEVGKGIDVFQRDKVDSKKVKPKKIHKIRAIAQKYFALRQTQVMKSTWDKEQGRYQNYIDLEFGDREFDDINKTELLEYFTSIAESIGAETGKRALGVFNQINAYAEDIDLAEVVIGQNLIKRMPKHKVKNMNAILDTELLGEYMYYAESKCDEVHLALRMFPHFGLRPNELLSMKWEDIDMKKREWNFYSPKYGGDWKCFLSDEVIRILQQAKELTGGKEYVFASYGKTGRVTSRAVQYRMEIGGFTNDIVHPHGFRATLETLGIDELKYPFEVVDLCLIHTPKGSLGKIYNRSLRLDERKNFYNDWSAFLVKLRNEYQRTKIKAVK